MKKTMIQQPEPRQHRDLFEAGAAGWITITTNYFTVGEVQPKPVFTSNWSYYLVQG
jgi:hypothetical protein